MFCISNNRLLMVSMTDHKCGISISLIFDTVFQYLLIFSYGIAVLGIPQMSPSLFIDTQRLESQQINH